MELAGIPEILEGYGLTGSADLLLRVVALDAEDLFRINGKILCLRRRGPDGHRPGHE